MLSKSRHPSKQRKRTHREISSEEEYPAPLCQACNEVPLGTPGVAFVLKCPSQHKICARCFSQSVHSHFRSPCLACPTCHDNFEEWHCKFVRLRPSRSNKFKLRESDYVQEFCLEEPNPKKDPINYHHIRSQDNNNNLDV